MSIARVVDSIIFAAMNLKNFKLSEFDSPDLPGSGSNMNPNFLQMLDEARDLAGVPFRINSGYRTKAHNAKVKGVSNSPHTKGFAADIHAPDGANKFKILKACIMIGFQRIGVYRTWIHVDLDNSLPTPTLWHK